MCETVRALSVIERAGDAAIALRLKFQGPSGRVDDRGGCHGEVIVRRMRSVGIRDWPISPRDRHSSLLQSMEDECLAQSIEGLALSTGRRAKR